MAAGIVIIGAGLAGHCAATGLRAAGYGGLLTLIGKEGRPAYDRPPLSKAAIMDEPEPQPTWLMEQASAESFDADLRHGVGAVSLDRQAKTVRLSDGSSLPYSKLLLTLGARPRPLTVPGGERALLLRNFEDAVALRRQFQPGRRIAVIGGGFIGLELAASAVRRGCRVTVIEAQARLLMRGVPETIARIVHDRHRAAGVEVLTGIGLAAIGEDGVHLADGRAIPCDTVVAGIGAMPETQLADAAGLAVANGIAVDAALRTSDPDIFAAGDCCSFPHPVFGGERIRLEAWRNAQDQGAFVAQAMLGRAETYTAIPWFWSDQYDLSLQVAGLPGLGSATVTRQAAEATILLFHRTDGGRLVGASGIGPGNTVARDIKLAEMLIARGACPDPEALASPGVSLKSLLKA
jgi:3-phenylpropionate/trans-cinnamate dioxygenase ferredoxin reductase subunit